MKQIIYALFVVLALAFISCEKDSFLENVGGSNNREFTFTLSTDGISRNGLQSRSVAVGESPKRWIMEVWDETGHNKVDCFGVNFDSHRSENSYGEFTVTLDETKTYICLFWADNGTPKVGNIAGSNGTYNADSLKAITLADGVIMHTKDAYFANVSVNGSEASQSIELKRAVAELRLVETGSNNPKQDITVTYDGYTAFNVATKSVVGSQSFSHFFKRDEFEVSGVEKRLGSFLTFATDSVTGVSIDFTVTESITNQVKEINGVKLYSNEITNIKGHFFESLEVIRSVNIVPQSDNVLRLDINIEFEKDVRYHIEYWKSDDSTSKRIIKPKESKSSTTETVLFLEPDTRYMFKVLAYSNSDLLESAISDFTTGDLPADLLSSMLMEDNKLENELSGYILQMRNISENYVTISNMNGIMVWYQDMGKSIEVVNFDAKTNTIVCMISEYTKDPFVVNQEIAVIDLMGNKLLSKEYNNLYAHHDIRRMPDGNIIFVNYVPKVFDLTQHGGKVDDFVWGDGYSIMNMAGAIIEEWDCFEELNPLDNPEINKFKGDWLHANSVNFDSEGNIYMSFNTPSELWKIEKESGKVLYRIGKNGNFDILPNEYTAGIHTLIPLKPDKILLLDNGRDNGITRAMIYDINEDAKTMKITLDVSLPDVYHTRFMGNVEIIIDGKLLMFNSSMTNSIIFTDYEGSIVRVFKLPYLAYRSTYIPEINY